MTPISRRGLLAIPAVLAGCARRKGGRYPGHAFVANAEGHSVSAVDLSDFVLERQIGLPAAPSAVLASRKRRNVYVLVPAAGALYELDGSQVRINRVARVPGPAVSMLLAPDGNSLWVLCGEGRWLVEIGLDDFRPGRRLRFPAAAVDFDLNAGGLAAVSFGKQGWVGFARLSALSMTRGVATGPDVGVVRFQSDGRQLLAGNRGNRSVSILRVETGRVVVHLPVPIEPARFCFSADGGQLFITGPGMDAAVIVYPYNTEVAETVLAGKAPGALATTGTPAYLFVANPPSGTVTVLDIETRKLVAVVNVGEEPHDIQITPDAQYALVLNRRSGDMAVIRLATLRTDAEGKPRRYKPVPLFNLIPVGGQPVSAAVI